MTVTHYDTLEVAADADQRTITKAYRRLARKLHPDTNPAPDASARMAAVSAAYAVLSHADKRAAYDRTIGSAPAAPAAAAGDGPALGPVTQAGHDLHTSVDLPADTAARGIDLDVPLTYTTACGACAGSGYSTTSNLAQCHDCLGLGMHPVTGQPCPVCRGAGTVSTDPCPTCAGTRGQVSETVVTVRIPPGVKSGQRIRVPRRGAPTGRAGASGDLYLDVTVRAGQTLASWFLVAADGATVGLCAPVTYPELRLGTVLDVPAPAGGTTRVTVPAGSQPGSLVVAAGAGLGGGDLHVRLDLVFSDSGPDAAERAALNTLAAAVPDPRAGLWLE